MVSVLVHTTLIRDQNGLGFSIAGGEGSPPFKDNSDVRILIYEIILDACFFDQLYLASFFKYNV